MIFSPKVEIINGNHFNDERGTLRFVNDFKLNGVKRFYTIEHHDKQVIRAWQGHEKETKYFMALQGKFVLAWVKIDDFEKPSPDLKAKHLILKANEPQVVYIPPGYANGLKALKSNSLMAVFSDMDVEQSVQEKRRYPKEWWFDWGLEDRKQRMESRK